MKVRSTPFERLVVGAAALLFIVGFALGYFKDAVWLNRFGSLIIVCGVVMAAIKLSDILDDQIERFMQKNHEQQAEQVMAVNRSFFRGSLPEGYEEKLRAELRKQVVGVFTTYKKHRLDRFKKVEVSVLIFGTLTNGFGDWVIFLIK